MEIDLNGIFCATSIDIKVSGISEFWMKSLLTILRFVISVSQILQNEKNIYAILGSLIYI